MVIQECAKEVWVFLCRGRDAPFAGFRGGSVQICGETGRGGT